MTETPAELLACPFCGGEAIQNKHGYVTCLGCGVEGPGEGSEESVTAWNSRVAGHYNCLGCGHDVIGMVHIDCPACGDQRYHPDGAHAFMEDERGECIYCGEGVSNERHKVGINWLDRYQLNKAAREAESRDEAAAKLAKASARLRAALLSAASRHPMSSELIVRDDYLAWAAALDAYEPHVAASAPNREHEQVLADGEVRRAASAHAGAAAVEEDRKCVDLLLGTLEYMFGPDWPERVDDGVLPLRTWGTDVGHALARCRAARRATQPGAEGR
jgi:hypothetical protein